MQSLYRNGVYILDSIIQIQETKNVSEKYVGLVFGFLPQHIAWALPKSSQK